MVIKYLKKGKFNQMQTMPIKLIIIINKDILFKIKFT